MLRWAWITQKWRKKESDTWHTIKHMYVLITQNIQVPKRDYKISDEEDLSLEEQSCRHEFIMVFKKHLDLKKIQKI